MNLPLTLLAAPALLLVGCGADPAPSTEGVAFEARGEAVEDFRALLGEQRAQGLGPVTLERISAGVPWPRGLVVRGQELVVLARGRHRRSGGIDPAIEDLSGSLLTVDTRVSEPVVPGRDAGQPVASNARLLAAPAAPPFQLYDPSQGPPEADHAMDRPYCTLAYDEGSENFFICGYSGVDLPGSRFRKNATDSIHRYDLRTARWYPVEAHDPGAPPADSERYVVSNEHYPHHDPAANPAPHGWLNGPDGALVVGDYLYAVGKDNHVLVQYDLAEVRSNPEAGPPASRPVLGAQVELRVPGGAPGQTRTMQVLGHSALAARDGYLYLGFRTSSVVLRLALDERGDLVRPAVAELIAVFSPWSAESGRSANLIDMDFDSRGRLHVSCASKGRVWNVGVPDPERPFDGVDEGPGSTVNRPWIDLGELTGNPAARTGNIAFDGEDRLYLCSGNYDRGPRIAGVIYRATGSDGLR